MEYGVFALFDKNPNDDNVSRASLLVFPPGAKRHRIFSFPKAVPWKMPGTDTVLWNDQWGFGVVMWIIGLFTRPGDYVADMFCGTGTATAAAIRMGRHAVAVDRNREAIRHTTTRLLEEKARLEENDLDGWEFANNAVSSMSFLPDWSTCDWSRVAEREKKIREHKRQQQENDKKRDKAEEKEKKKEESNKKALRKLKKNRKKADDALAKAQEDAADAEKNDEQADDDDDDEEEDDDDEEEPIDSGLQDEIDIGTIYKELDDIISKPQGLALLIGPVTPAQTRSKDTTHADDDQ
jgi:SAM-dependent methyltransferase